MQILVLTKPVPGPGGERRATCGPDFRLDRTASPTVVNGNDEYALEAALQLVEAHGGEVAILAMAPGQRDGDDAQGARDGRAARRARHGPGARGRRPAGDRARARRRGRRRRPFDLLLTGLDTSDGTGGAVAAGVAASARPAAAVGRGAPSSPIPATGRVRVKRLSAKGYDLIEAPMPAVISCTQALGAPRYPSLKGIMAARQREIARQGRSPTSGADDGAAARRRVGDPRDRRRSAARRRATGRVVKAPAADAAREIADFLADRRLI